MDKEPKNIGLEKETGTKIDEIIQLLGRLDGAYCDIAAGEVCGDTEIENGKTGWQQANEARDEIDALDPQVAELINSLSEAELTLLRGEVAKSGQLSRYDPVEQVLTRTKNEENRESR